MRHDEIVAQSISLLAQMVSTPSLSGQESAVAELVSGHLTLLRPTEMRRLGNSVVAVWKGVTPGPTLLLCSHLDTVAPASGWTRNPFSPTFENGRLYGLGTNDAGASVVSMIGAVASITPLERGTIILCLAAEEELGSNGFMAIEPLLPRYDAAIFGEPTDMGVAAEMRGAMKILMRSRGVAAHASRPWEGRNAIDSFISDMAKIRGIPLNDDSPWGAQRLNRRSFREAQAPTNYLIASPQPWTSGPHTIETTRGYLSGYGKRGLSTKFSPIAEIRCATLPIIHL